MATAGSNAYWDDWEAFKAQGPDVDASLEAAAFGLLSELDAYGARSAGQFQLEFTSAQSGVDHEDDAPWLGVEDDVCGSPAASDAAAAKERRASLGGSSVSSCASGAGSSASQRLYEHAVRRQQAAGGKEGRVQATPDINPRSKILERDGDVAERLQEQGRVQEQRRNEKIFEALSSKEQEEATELRCAPSAPAWRIDSGGA